ncbi:hypothetical protein PCANB_000810 [Pneumocystis canis]|nr:hypothetical protein PCANB_000810 [Pneumocystis canis]
MIISQLNEHLDVFRENANESQIDTSLKARFICVKSEPKNIYHEISVLKENDLISNMNQLIDVITEFYDDVISIIDEMNNVSEKTEAFV